MIDVFVVPRRSGKTRNMLQWTAMGPHHKLYVINLQERRRVLEEAKALKLVINDNQVEAITAPMRIQDSRNQVVAFDNLDLMLNEWLFKRIGAAKPVLATASEWPFNAANKHDRSIR